MWRDLRGDELLDCRCAGSAGVSSAGIQQPGEREVDYPRMGQNWGVAVAVTPYHKQPLSSLLSVVG